MLKRFTCLLLTMIFLTGTFSLTGCSNKKDGQDEEAKKTIKFATFYSDSGQGGIYKDIAREYEKTNPNVKIEVTSDFGNEEKLKEAMSGKGQFDIIGIKRNQLIEFAKAGQLSDMSEIVQKNKLDNQLFEISFAYGKYNGRQYGLGDIPIVYEWFYNVDMFKKNKLSEPVNLKELLATAKKLKSKGIRPISLGAIDGWTVSTLFGMITAQTTGAAQFTENYGSDLTTFKKMTTMDTAFSIFNDLASNAINSDSDSINYKQSVEDFVNGKAAILPAGSYATDLINKVKQAGFNYSVFGKGIEMTKNPASLFSASASQVLTIPTNSKNQNEVGDFIKYLYSEEVQKKFIEKGYRSALISANKTMGDMDQLILSHLNASDSNSIMLFDNLEPTMLESLTMVLKDSIQGRVKSKEAWNRVLKFTFQR